MAFHGRSIIYSSHILEEVEEAADNILIIHRGKKLYEGSIDEAKDRYAEYILENPKDIVTFKTIPGVLYIKENSANIYSLFVDKFQLKTKITAKKFNLKLKEIFMYLLMISDTQK